MNSQPMQGYSVDAGGPRGAQEYINNLRGPMKNPARDGYEERQPDHLSVGGMTHLFASEARQLFEEISMLRERLSPVLAEQKTPPMGIPSNPPVMCKMAAEMSDILITLQQARQCVSLTLSQLDL